MPSTCRCRRRRRVVASLRSMSVVSGRRSSAYPTPASAAPASAPGPLYLGGMIHAARSAIQAASSEASQPVAPAEIWRRCGNLPFRSRRQRVERLRPVISRHSGSRMKRSVVFGAIEPVSGRGVTTRRRQERFGFVAETVMSASIIGLMGCFIGARTVPCRVIGAGTRNSR